MNYFGDQTIADFIDGDYLEHYGRGHEDGGHSGRYPWGSGEDPFQHADDFVNYISRLRKDGKSDVEIAEELGFTDKYNKPSASELKVAYSAAQHEADLSQIAKAQKLKEDGWSNSAIAKEMGWPNESTVRSKLDEAHVAKIAKARNIANDIESIIDEKGMVDIGTGVEQLAMINCTPSKMDEVVFLLQKDGYPVYSGRIPQVTNKDLKTTQKVACPPGTPFKDIYQYDKVTTLEDYVVQDDGSGKERLVKGFEFPPSLDPSRLQIVYGDEGGTDKDGLIELRRDVKDLNLGDSRYAQVRILVDNDRYLKGMAAYADDLPDGIDVRFNTNKRTGTPMRDVLKKVKTVKDPETGEDVIDKENPFGALIKVNGGQSRYEDENGESKLSLINKTREEDEWTDFKDSLPAQFLSKQNKSLVKKQLALSVADKQDQYETLKSLENPTVKKYFLESFADECDDAALHLKAAAFPRQKWHVILPLNTLKDDEIYAPQYDEGTQVALVRYPHAGTFEIPICTVNHKNRLGRKMIGTDSVDAVGISGKTAQRLSGADFDGDTVMVIPITDRVKVMSKPLFKDLEGFDPSIEYPHVEGAKVMRKENVQKEMGSISNLITDMTIKGATEDELVRAVKHSMVVIDAYKKELDYTRSAKDNDIIALKEKYQLREEIDEDGKLHRHTGASTIVSKAKSQTSIKQRQGQPKIDPETGELIYKESGRFKLKKNPDGTYSTTDIPATQKSYAMNDVKDAYELVSDGQHPIELMYADYANKMKALANEARKEYAYNTPRLEYSKEANSEYSEEVHHLTSQLTLSKLNAPREREAQRIANARLKALMTDNPDLKDDKKEKGKTAQRLLTNARLEVGAKRNEIDITPKDWEAIQKGAIHDSTLREILQYSNKKKIREYAMPKEQKTIPASRITKMRAMVASGFTLAEIAEECNVSPSTVKRYTSLKNDKEVND